MTEIEAISVQDRLSMVTEEIAGESAKRGGEPREGVRGRGRKRQGPAGLPALRPGMTSRTSLATTRIRGGANGLAEHSRNAELSLRQRVSLLRRRHAKPRGRGFVVPRHANAIGVHHAESVLRRCAAPLGPHDGTTTVSTSLEKCSV